MTEFLKIEEDGVKVKEILSAKLLSAAQELTGKHSIWVLTGGSSVPFWAEPVIRAVSSLPLAKICLTDTFLEQDALAQGREDTNEEAVLSAGLFEALARQKISAGQLLFPNFSLTEPQAIADDLNRRVLEHRGKAKFDVVIASAGGGNYYSGGPVDPGHVFGIPHGQPEVFESEGPYVVVNDMPKPPSTRITLNGTGIERMFTFCLGEKKINALLNLQDELPPELCPAGLAHTVRESVVVHS